MNKETQDYDWDAFISHASEDKEEVVLPLYELLTKKGMKVWVDKYEIFLGDSLRRKLDEGLTKSRFGIVILNEQFFQKEWTKKELDALLSREDGKEKVILPIWHKVDKSVITKNSPLLSDKIAISTNKGLEVVAEEIYRTYKKDLDEKGIFFSKSEIYSLNEAIRYFRGREGNFSSTDPIALISGKLKNNKEGVNIKNFNSVELSNLLSIINENIKYMNSYEYKGLPYDAALDHKQTILESLFKLRAKIKEHSH